MRETEQGGTTRMARHVSQYHAGGSNPASKADPLNLGFPFTIDPRLLLNAVSVGTAGNTWFYRVTGGGLISKLGLYVSASSGNIRASVWSNSGVGRAATPNTRVATTGSIACPAAGAAVLTLDTSVQVTSGDFWFSIAADNTTAQFAGVSTGGFLVDGLAGNQSGTVDGPSGTPAPAFGGNRLIGLVGVA